MVTGEEGVCKCRVLERTLDLRSMVFQSGDKDTCRYTKTYLRRNNEHFDDIGICIQAKSVSNMQTFVSARTRLHTD
jgi:hypothetical protein